MNSVLVLDTSTSICAVAIYQNQNLLSTICLHQPNVHSEKAALLIDQVLNISKIPVQQLTHLAIAKGPGSYTGLRIGFALLKSMSYALKIPILGFSTLLGQAQSFVPIAQQMKYPILSCLDAGRNEVYAAFIDNQGNLLHDLGACVLPHPDIKKILTTHSTLIIGNGANKILEHHPSPPYKYLLFPYIENPIANLGYLLEKKIAYQEYQNLITFEPDYIKPVHITISKK